MKIFLQSELKAAYEYVKSGETAVHLHFIVFPTSPACFRRDVANGVPIAHVMSLDADLLQELAARVGVKRIVIEKPGTLSQHVDMCGEPLRFTLEEMGEDINNYKRGVMS